MTLNNDLLSAKTWTGTGFNATVPSSSASVTAASERLLKAFTLPDTTKQATCLAFYDFENTDRPASVSSERKHMSFICND